MLYLGRMQKLLSVYSEAVLQLDGSHLELLYALLNELSDHYKIMPLSLLFLLKYALATYSFCSAFLLLLLLLLLFRINICVAYSIPYSRVHSTN